MKDKKSDRKQTNKNGLRAYLFQRRFQQYVFPKYTFGFDVGWFDFQRRWG